MLVWKPNEIPISAIKVCSQQPRLEFDSEELMELKNSIKEFGILQPLIVKKESGGGYSLIAGERRLRAARMAGLDKVPAIVRDASDEQVGMIALVENIQRSDLGYIEEAKAYKNLMEKYGISQIELAGRLGKKQSTISNKIRILTLPEDIQKLLVESKLTERHGRALLKIQDNSQRHVIINKVLKHNLNVKQTEKLVEDYLKTREKLERDTNRVRHISYKLYLNTLKKTFNDMELKTRGGTFNHEDTGSNYKITITIPYT